jgi:hypothetical protein
MYAWTMTFESRELKRMFRHTRDEVTGDGEKDYILFGN